MMRVYSSILMSSLLLSAGAVNAQSLETRSTFFAQDNSAPEILTTLAGTLTFDADNGKDEPPPRGTGR
ncbi:heterocyst-inhibiting protein PatX [Microcoleus vaginatus]|uniref:heterocyst-inhibiting protein PatX n=1 Tax=Microcoleus vaginatus TaxID=119532 RepID=UPI0032A8A3A2